MKAYNTVMEQFSKMTMDDHFLSNSQVSPLPPYSTNMERRKTSNHIENDHAKQDLSNFEFRPSDEHLRNGPCMMDDVFDDETTPTQN